MPVLLLSGVLGHPGSPVADPLVTVRVLTYNIQHGEGTDGRLDLARQAEVIRSVEPDLVALQKVDQGAERSGGVRQLDELSRLLGMHGQFGKAMDHLGGEYGVGVLSRWPLLTVANQPLPGSHDREPRTALTVTVRVGQDGQVLQLTSTHLDQSREISDRMGQVRRLNELLADGRGRPAILAGDFNARRDVGVLATLAAEWTNVAVAASEPTSAPGRGRRGPRSDFVLVRPAEGWRVIEWRVVDAPVASDHRPVLAVLEWTGR